MKKLLSLLLVLTVLISCEEKHSGNMVVKGNIQGLKKGTLYLQKLNDTLLVSVDSIQLNGKSNFVLSDEIESAEVYYITLDEIPTEKIMFFGEKGEITITAKLDKLGTSTKITGSSNQLILDEYEKIADKFKGQQLDLIKDKFEARKAKDAELLTEIDKKERSLIKRQYLYTTNFALNHADTEVAPYLALTKLYNANIKLLDTVNNSLTSDVKISKYGVQLNEFIKNIKETE